MLGCPSQFNPYPFCRFLASSVNMSVYGQREPGAATYTIIVGIAVAVVLALLSVPGLDLFLRLVAFLALGILAVLNLMVLRGSPSRLKNWRMRRRWRRALNVTSGLVPDLGRMIESTQALLYDNRQGTLMNLVGLIAQKAPPEHRTQVESKVLALASHYEIFTDMTESDSRWERNSFIAFVRALGKHFESVDPVLDACYEIAKTIRIDDPTIKGWAIFKENYNQLRARWEAYFGRVPRAIGLHIQLGGKPAVALPEFRPDSE